MEAGALGQRLEPWMEDGRWRGGGVSLTGPGKMARKSCDAGRGCRGLLFSIGTRH